ncbi:nucleoside-triphosphatase [Nonomuraea jiangxiensis]|uniref:Nucleoside-triphosphatase n=1 Tax=Nonomuraea jiangxiensis TaxID=633440 RepID=A0A1G9S422_9ACTN|nr:nucleoside-triphosphatase [Nonomuraea jiangxiensis]SDM30152.1 nucleoside-triphosphatase [Nonomuraea jiangxiensis]
MSRPHILITAPPRTGKTTVVRRLADLLQAVGVPVCGFVSDELREHGQRVGFTVEEFGGRKTVMAHVSWASGPRIGRYGVNVPDFERIALPAMERAMTTRGAVALIDEIGPMELLSPAFLPRCMALFNADLPVVATVHQRSHPMLKTRLEADLITVTPQNRDELPETLKRLLSD